MTAMLDVGSTLTRGRRSQRGPRIKRNNFIGATFLSSRLCFLRDDRDLGTFRAFYGVEPLIFISAVNQYLLVCSI